MSQAIIIQVGATIKENQGLSPLFADKTFEYIPGALEEDFNRNKSHNHRHFSMLGCQNENLLGMNMSSFVQETTAHLDPEFYSFTYVYPTSLFLWGYGESGKIRMKQLKTLEHESWIVFVSYLQAYNLKGDNFLLKGSPSLYAIGYFHVPNPSIALYEVSEPFNDNTLGFFSSTCNEHIIYRNAHIRTPEGRSLLLVQGEPQTSVLFRRPLKLASKGIIMKKYKDGWGMKTPALPHKSQLWGIVALWLLFLHKCGSIVR